jgi:GAF domain
MKAYEKSLVEEAETKYRVALNSNMIVQTLLLLISVPALGSVIYRLRNDSRNRLNLLMGFEQSNRDHLFNSGVKLSEVNPESIIGNSINNLKNASSFVRDITEGNYEVTWDELTESNKSLNQDNLVGNLIKMRDKMKFVKAEDEKRLWGTEGLAKFSEIARVNQSDIDKLSLEVVRFFAKYLGAQQGSLFILQDEVEGQEPSLELKACYAFDRKKFIQKTVPIGSGLVGQAYLEGKTTLLTAVPQGYVSITSGLGDTSPSCLVIVPMKYNDKVEAVLELASLKKFKEYEISFLEKAGEVIASSINATKTNERTTRLLRESQEQAEILRSQEEELRQSMEELQATQENIRRRENEQSQIDTK